MTCQRCGRTSTTTFNWLCNECEEELDAVWSALHPNLPEVSLEEALGRSGAAEGQKGFAPEELEVWRKG